MDPSKDLFSPNPATPQERIRSAYNRAFVNWQAYWVEAYRDQSFYLNNQWTPEERRYLQQEQRPEYTYNLIRTAINMVGGYQCKNRKSLIYKPLENSSDRTADLHTKCLFHEMRKGKGHRAISDAFKGALTTGIGWVMTKMDYRFDTQSGDLDFEFIPWNSIIADPFWTQRDLSDCDYIIRRAYMSKQQAISNWPDKKEQIAAMQGNMRDELFTFLPEQRIFQSQNLLCYTEYWEQQYEEVTVVINPMTLQEIEITEENRSFMKQLIQIPGVKSYKRMKKKMVFYALLNNEVIQEDVNPYNLNDYPFTPVLAIYEPEYDLYQYKLQSLIRPARDAQIQSNKYISKMTDVVDSQINSGWIVKKTRFDNPMDFFKTGQGRVIFAKNEADLNNDARQLMSNAGASVAPVMELQKLFDSLILRCMGVNEELLGIVDNANDVGLIAKMRQAAGLVTLQDIFDGLDQSMEIIANKALILRQNNYTAEKVQMITKEQPTEEFYDKNFGKYDAVAVEAPLTDDQQQLFFQQMLQFKQLGAPVPWKTILDAYPGQGKTKLFDDIKQEEQQQQQMAQAQMQAEMQDKSVINELLRNESLIKIASAKEKLAKAEDDRADAVHKRALAAKELDSVDMDNINKLIDALIKIENADHMSEDRELALSQPGGEQ